MRIKKPTLPPEKRSKSRNVNRAVQAALVFLWHTERLRKAEEEVLTPLRRQQTQALADFTDAHKRLTGGQLAETRRAVTTLVRPDLGDVIKRYL